MERRKVDTVLCVRETKWKESMARSTGGGFKVFYHGVDGKRNGLGVILKEEYVDRVAEVIRVPGRIMNLKEICSKLDEVTESVPRGEYW